MKHLKTFEQHNQFATDDQLNEEIFGKARKFLTGHESSEDRDEAMMSFHKALAEAEATVAKAPEKFAFNKESIEQKAKENNYKGGIRIQRGGRNKSKVYVVYDEGVTGFQQLAAGAGAERRERGI